MNKIDLIIDALESAHCTNDTGVMGLTKMRRDVALSAARELQTLQPHPDHYAEVYIRVGDLHIKKVLTSIEFMQSHDPIRLLSLRADNALREIKELL
jgi:hypothetical protein